MDKKELSITLKEGEGYFIEFKENLSSSEKDFVAFANSSGGKVFLGVTDEGKIKGLNITNKLKSDIQNIVRNCDPPIEITIKPFENILIVKVEEGEDKPYRCSSGFYKRIGSNSQKMTRNEILDFFKSEGKVRFDELMNKNFEYPKNFSRKRLSKFLELAGLSKALPARKTLINLGITETQDKKLYFNNAGVLFFAKEPQRLIPWSVFTVVLFKDKEGIDIIDRKEIIGGLFEIVEQVIDFVRLYAKVAYRITGRPQRENIYEYPFKAIREAVINSVMHKDYFEHGHNNILKFFPDRIQIENIWVKPKKFILGKTVFRRNHLVADLFSRIHFGEKIGSGMKRMRDICKKENTPYPEIKYTDTHFYVVFKQSREYIKIAEEEVSEKVVRKGGQKRWSELTKRQIEILQLIRENPKISRKELSEELSINPSAIQKYIERLKKKIFIERIGPDKGGYWKVL
jgi:ATP-dependent DNA helicase RecG